ncbi:MAG TPA: hypothetical protein ENJ41_07290 [Oceanospirillales bacterium]|nr:hypothetical protein [Oceanospirillales bacterium]
MIVDLLKAIIFAGVPVAFISYYLIVFTKAKVKLSSKNATQLKKELKAIKSVDKGDDNFFQQALQKKYLKFGGGFYGVVTLITYVHIELYQILEFIWNFKGFTAFIDSIGFSMVINFFIELVMNLIKAFMWPVYWYKYLPIGSFWVWLLVALVAHTAASRWALRDNKESQVSS